MKTLGFGTPQTIGAAAAGVVIITGAVWGFASWSNGNEEKSIVPKELSAAVLKEQAKTDRLRCSKPGSFQRVLNQRT